MVHIHVIHDCLVLFNPFNKTPEITLINCSLCDLFLYPSLVGLHCALELDEYGRFDRKARTLPVNTDMTTLTTTWDQDFEVEIAGAHMMKVMVFSKYLLKEEVCASGKLKVHLKHV